MCRPAFPADTHTACLLYFTALDVRIMSKKMKIVVLGTEDYLTKSLISLILEKDVSNSLMNLKKCGIYEVTYIPISAREDIEKKCSPPPDMCLLTSVGEISSENVWPQIDDLHKRTGIPTEEFIVVLPLQHGQKSYPFKCYTLEKLFSKLAGDRKRPLPEMETDNSSSLISRGLRLFSSFSSSSSSGSSFKGNHSDSKVNLVLLGMSGTGKSVTGNTILGEKRFVSRVSSMPVTTECQEAETEINGKRVCIIDTPDIFDDEIKSSVKNQHVTDCRDLCQSGPCVYLLVIQVGRFTDGERDILKKLEEVFGSEARRQTVILFTHGKELQRAKLNLESFLHSCQPELKKIVERCGKRCVVFENSGPRQPQVTELMRIVNWMLNKQ